MGTLLTADRSETPHRNKPFITPSPESSDSSSDRIAREFPNLSDCYSCNVRIKCTNTRENLQLMDSMWRIVLLCKECSTRVNSSELCPYCFSAVVDGEECFKCGECRHSIHKKCVERYGSESGLSVCVDCWIPDALVSSVRVRKRKVRKRNNECRESNEVNLVEEEVKRKVAAAVKASENAVRKAVVAKNAVELARGILSVVASRRVAGGCETEVVDDAELAFLLHRAISSSPKISRYACLGSSFRRDDVAVACYSRRRASKKIALMNSGTSNGPLVCYSKKNSVSLNAPLMCYSRRRSRSNHGADLENGFDSNNCQQNDVRRTAMKPRRCLLKYYRIGKGTSRPLFYVEDSECSHINSANLYAEGMSDARNFSNGYECHETCEKFDKKANRFLLKYRRNLRSN